MILLATGWATRLWEFALKLSPALLPHERRVPPYERKALVRSAMLVLLTAWTITIVGTVAIYEIRWPEGVPVARQIRIGLQTVDIPITFNLENAAEIFIQCVTLALWFAVAKLKRNRKVVAVAFIAFLVLPSIWPLALVLDAFAGWTAR